MYSPFLNPIEYFWYKVQEVLVEENLLKEIMKLTCSMVYHLACCQINMKPNAMSVLNDYLFCPETSYKPRARYYCGLPDI